MASDYLNTNYLTHHTYPLPGENDYWIYFYHTGDYIILPTYPDQISDQLQVSYSSELPLGRSAPLLSYGGSGPRAIQFSFVLHRDIMWQLNYNNLSISGISVDDDYVDQMAKKIQGAALPEYAVADKMVSPPMVAVKIGSEVFIKGVVTGSVGVVYKPPILKNGKFANIDISFTVTEVIPYSASKAMELGSYRNTGYSLMTKYIYTPGSTTTKTSTLNTGVSKTVNGVTVNTGGAPIRG